MFIFYNLNALLIFSLIEFKYKSSNNGMNIEKKMKKMSIQFWTFYKTDVYYRNNIVHNNNNNLKNEIYFIYRHRRKITTKYDTNVQIIKFNDLQN